MIRKTLCEKSLHHYVRNSWKVVEPNTPYVDGWHIEAICEHLEAVTRGEIVRLLINIPPRHMKSLTVCVMWPSWEWGPKNMPYTRWLLASYSDVLSTRDNLKCRRLIKSPWYQALWGERFEFTGDQNQKTRFENDKHGYRIATSVRGTGTGEGGDRVVVDDPHNVIKGESETDRLATLNWWDESMSTRGNHPIKSAKIIIMQRIHDEDLSGHVIKKFESGDSDGIPYVHLCLPARYEKKHIFPVSTPLLSQDPRTEEGEPLWKELYNDRALKVVESDMTEYARAGQLQQRPHPRGGGIFKIENFKLVKNQPSYSEIVKVVRYWDKAATEDGGKRSAGVLMALLVSGKVRVCDVRKGQWSSAKREKLIKQSAELDDRRWHETNVAVWVEQEPGSGGKESAENTIKNLAGHVVFSERPTGDKIVRSEPYQSAVENGMVELVMDSWTQDFIDEHEKAPNGSFKDQWDAASGAYNRLCGKRKRAGGW